MTFFKMTTAKIGKGETWQERLIRVYSEPDGHVCHKGRSGYYPVRTVRYLRHRIYDYNITTYTTYLGRTTVHASADASHGTDVATRCRKYCWHGPG